MAMFDNYVADGFDYSKCYPIPKSMESFIDSIEKIGTRHYKVHLKVGRCYIDNGSHKYIVPGDKLFWSFNYIETCGCLNCIKSGVTSIIKPILHV